jgi:hypothetical protein
MAVFGECDDVRARVVQGREVGAVPQYDRMGELAFPSWLARTRHSAIEAELDDLRYSLARFHAAIGELAGFFEFADHRPVFGANEAPIAGSVAEDVGDAGPAAVKTDDLGRDGIGGGVPLAGVLSRLKLGDLCPHLFDVAAKQIGDLFDRLADRESPL